MSQELYNGIKRIDLKQIKLCLKNGANVDSKYEIGNTPLILTVITLSKIISKFYHASGIKLNFISDPNYGLFVSPLDEIIDEKTNVLLKRGFKNIYEEGKKIVKKLLKYNADINKQNDIGDNPLLLAIMLGNEKIAKYLIKKGANLNITNNDGYNALDLSLKNRHYKIAEILLKKGLKTVNNLSSYELNELLIQSSREGLVRLTKFLLKRGANPNYTDNHKYTPLMYASIENHIDIVELLLENEADINYLDNTGSNALIYAILEENLDIVKLLIRNGADVNIKASNGLTPLMHIYDRSRLYRKKDSRKLKDDSKIQRKITEILIKHGADITIEDKSGKTFWKYVPKDERTSEYKNKLIELANN